MVNTVKVKKQKSKRNYLIVLLVLFVSAAVLCTLYVVRHRRSEPQATVNNPSTVNLQPATAEDKQRVDETKDAIVQKDKTVQQPSTQTGKKSVTPTITYASQAPSGDVEVDGYVSGVYEDGGTCTATFKSGSATVTKDVQAVKNVSSVNCPAIIVPKDSFSPKGSWEIILSYNSGTASGSSAPKQVTVQ